MPLFLTCADSSCSLFTSIYEASQYRVRKKNWRGTLLPSFFSKLKCVQCEKFMRLRKKNFNFCVFGYFIFFLQNSSDVSVFQRCVLVIIPFDNQLRSNSLRIFKIFITSDLNVKIQCRFENCIVFVLPWEGEEQYLLFVYILCFHLKYYLY